jgi:hypothetical protein
LTIEFDDGEQITTTPHHLFLLPSGEWIEAGLLLPMDMIQSGMYGGSIFQWIKIHTLSWRKIFQSWAKAYALFGLGVLQRDNSAWLSYSSQRPQSKKQSHSQFRVDTQRISPLETYDSRKTGKAKAMDRKDTSTCKQVAWIKRGNRISQMAWEEVVGKSSNHRKRMCSLPHFIYNTIFRKIALLWAKLQNESQTKTVKRVTRGWSSVVYNLDVENTHCLLANGIIAHNCMDAGRYAMVSIVPIKRKPEYDPYDISGWTSNKENKNPAR